ncbi:hypothetical protein [Mycobacteroides abscessus]|uniref:hypothetical protein n=1 Tax=Mycobacteroides abscessus TaxID=36809 RepID=UPI0015FEE6E7|nr:hypothetical protein [Mycobacteroides abscessus]
MSDNGFDPAAEMRARAESLPALNREGLLPEHADGLERTLAEAKALLLAGGDGVS